jgi:3-dehydroquinate synthase
LSEAHYQGLLKKPALGYLLSATRDQLFDVKASTLNQFRRLLLSDKKKTQAESVRFIFLRKPGACVIQEVSVDEILIELCRQREEDSDG